MHNAIQSKRHTMKKLNIDIDAHALTNEIGLAFNNMGSSILYGKASVDLNDQAPLSFEVNER